MIYAVVTAIYGFKAIEHPVLFCLGNLVVYAITAFIVTFILAKAVDVTIGLRVKEEEEYVGLDISQHGERA